LFQKKIEVKLIKKIREVKKLGPPEELKAQIKKDLQILVDKN